MCIHQHQYLIEDNTHILLMTHSQSTLIENGILPSVSFGKKGVFFMSHLNTTLLTLIITMHREREMFYLTTHSTHFIYGYMTSDMVKDHSDSEKGNLLQPHRLLLSINSMGSFICTIPQTG